MYSLVLSDLATKQLSKLEKRDAQRIIAALERCRVRPHAHVKRLVDSPHYRLRVGKYRVFLAIDDGALVIFAIAIHHRENAY